MPKISNAQKQINDKKLQTYFDGLKGTLNLMNQPDFKGYSVKIENTDLVKLLLCHCIDKKLYLPDYVSGILKKALLRNKVYKSYFNENLDVEIKDISYMHFFQRPYCLTNDEKMIGKTGDK